MEVTARRALRREAEGLEQLRGALEDIRGLESTVVLAWPVCGMILAAMGAGAVEIEPPEGDPSAATATSGRAPEAPALPRVRLAAACV